VVRWFGRDTDEAGDCFLYVCEQLRRNQFRRLRRFKPDGRASFPTWLRAVVRNLCLDWYRRRHGRYRVFQSVARLSDLDQQVFRHICERGLSVEECTETLRPAFATVSSEQIETSLEHLRNTLGPHQMRLLNVRRSRTHLIDADGSAPPGGREVEDPAPDPEIQAALKEGLDKVQRALACLPDSDRLLLLLRFEQELTLAQVARMVSLQDAQAADRRIRGALAKIREHLGVTTETEEKAHARSV
jgi:RNA polymerase sigma factor (sigma-70 family)